MGFEIFVLYLGRKQRAQRMHMACCYQAWFSLKVRAKKLKTTLWSHYLRSKLQ